MEKLMPANIHVVSMKPEFDRQNQLVLHVVVATGARDKAVELVKQMEKSPHFRSAQVEAENTTGNEGNMGAPGGNIQFEIAAVYLPFAEDAEADTGGDQPDKTKAPEKTGAKPTSASKPDKAKAPEKTGAKPTGKSKPAATPKASTGAGGGR